MLKPAKEANIDILSVEDYVELFGKPNDNFGEQDQELLYRLIKQATTQFDSLVSPAGQVGSLFKWWNNLKDNDEDNSRGFRLQKAIGSWVETMVQNGKFWVDGIPQMSSNIDYQINSSSKNSNIELKRKDIIQDLTAIGLTITTNLGIDTRKENNTIDKNELDNWMVLSKEWVSENFLALDSKQYNQRVISAIDMNDNDIQNCGNIWQASTLNKSTLTNFKLIGCEILLEDNNNVECLKAQQADKILDPHDGVYKLISQFDVNYFGGLTEEEIYQAITNAGALWNPNITYRENFIVMFQKENVNKKKIKNNGELYSFAMSKQNDNRGNNPNNSPDYWLILDAVPVDINSIIIKLKEYIDNNLKPDLVDKDIPQEIANQLDKLKTTNLITEPKDKVLSFANDADYQQFKNENNIDDSYFQEVSGNDGESILFFEGQVSFFENKGNFLRFISNLENTNKIDRRLEINQDYREYPEGLFLKLSNELETTAAGENSYLLKRSDLPNLDIRYKWIERFVNTDSTCLWGRENVIAQEVYDPGQTQLQSSGNSAKKTNQITLSYFLNGNVPQTKIDINPKHITIYAVKWLKDIVVKNGGGVSSVGGGNTNIDTSNFVTKTEFNNSQNAQNEKINKNTNEMTAFSSGLTYVNEGLIKTTNLLETHIENRFLPLLQNVETNTAEIEKLKQSGGGSGNVDTTNLANLNEENTFKRKNTFLEDIAVGLDLEFGIGRRAIQLRNSVGQLYLTVKEGEYLSGMYEPKDGESVVHKRYVDTTIKESMVPLQEKIEYDHTKIIRNESQIELLWGTVGTGGFGGDIYTNQEIYGGYRFNGAKVYVNCFSNLSDSLRNGKYYIKLPQNVDKIIKFEGFASYENGKMVALPFSNSNISVWCEYDVNERNWYIFSSVGNNEGPHQYIVHYTKVGE